MCLYPKLIKNRKYMSNKKNGGNIPPVKDMRTKLVPIGCGKCMECRKQKKREWQVRLHEEIKKNKIPAWFVTMTYSDQEIQKLDDEINKELKGYNRDNEIARLSIRRFTERWRKKYKKTVRHWLVTELGTNKTERLHIHGILWCKNKEDISRIWKYGGVYIGEYVNEKTINYIVKYLNKADKIHKEYIPKMFVSQGIGNKYLKGSDIKRNKYKENEETDETYRTINGLRLALPVYYRNYIYNEEEREKLWIEKLDKKERWVDGIKINIKENDKEYYIALKNARIKNRRLGYGNNEIDWNRKEYEQQRRNLKRMERVKKIYG